MKGLGAFVVLLGLMFGATAYAQEGITHPPTSELKAVSSMKGLCTDDNKETLFYQTHCLAIKEQLQKPCSQELVNKLRTRMQGKQAQGDTKGFGLGAISCPNDYQAIEKNPQNLEMLIMEFMAAIGIAESGHREYNNLDNFAKADNSGKQGGLFNLKEEWIKDEKYKCGCENINSKTGEGQKYEGKDLGVADGPMSATCATYIALYWAEKHETFAGGSKKGNSKNCLDKTKPEDEDEGPKGAACIFESLQEYEQKPGDPPLKPEQEARNPNLNFLKKKIRNYCEKNINPNGDLKVNPWDKINGLDAPANR